jgi:hypothetical protein
MQNHRVLEQIFDKSHRYCRGFNARRNVGVATGAVAGVQSQSTPSQRAVKHRYSGGL